MTCIGPAELRSRPPRDDVVQVVVGEAYELHDRPAQAGSPPDGAAPERPLLPAPAGPRVRSRPARGRPTGGFPHRVNAVWPPCPRRGLLRADQDAATGLAQPGRRPTPAGRIRAALRHG